MWSNILNLFASQFLRTSTPDSVQLEFERTYLFVPFRRQFSDEFYFIVLLHFPYLYLDFFSLVFNSPFLLYRLRLRFLLPLLLLRK